MIYITGDTHGDIDINKLSIRSFPAQKLLSKSDYVIICGDFGFIWSNDNTQRYWLRWLANKSFTTLFIDGNHENFNLLNQYPIENWNGGKIHKINTSIFHLMRGNVFTINGISIFTFGGAESIDKIYRKEDISWWKEEMPNDEEYIYGINCLKKYNNHIDLILSHTAPSSILNKIEVNGYIKPNILSDYLEKIRLKVNYKEWFIGHYHLDQYFNENNIHLVYNKIHEIDLTTAST